MDVTTTPPAATPGTKERVIGKIMFGNKDSMKKETAKPSVYAQLLVFTNISRQNHRHAAGPRYSTM
jgi:hypothetical protein